MTLIAAVILGLLAPTMSWAACETTYTNNAMAEDIVAVRSLFDEGELSDAKRRLLEMGEGATCLDKLAEPGLIARFGQLMALSFFFAQDEDQAERWALLAYSSPRCGPPRRLLLGRCARLGRCFDAVFGCVKRVP